MTCYYVGFFEVYGLVALDRVLGRQFRFTIEGVGAITAGLSLGVNPAYYGVFEAPFLFGPQASFYLNEEYRHGVGPVAT